MCAWRLPGAPRFGIGFVGGPSCAAGVVRAGDDLGSDFCAPFGGTQHPTSHPERPAGVTPRGHKRGFSQHVETDADEETRFEQQQRKILQVRYGSGIVAGAQSRSGLYCWTGADGIEYADDDFGAEVSQDHATQRIDSRAHFEPEAVVWPTYREELEGDELDWGPSAPPPPLGEGLAAADTPTVFELEVERILGTSAKHHHSILGLVPEEWGDVQAMQSKYRHLMRLLHPDKRRPEEVARAGGKATCDRAVEMVQRALAAAKKAAEDDPRLRLQQEIQRQHARQAMQRQQTEPTGPDLESLLSSIDKVASSGNGGNSGDPVARMQQIQRQQARQAMQRQNAQQDRSDLGPLLQGLSEVVGGSSSGPSPDRAAPQASSTTTAQIVDLLASLRQ